MRPTHQDLRSDLDAHPDKFKQLGALLTYQSLELALKLGLLEGEVLDAACGGPQCQYGTPALIVVSTHPVQSRAGANELACGQATQTLAQLIRRADYQRLELADRRNAGKHRGTSGRHQYA